MIRTILPAPVVAAEAFGDPPSPIELFAEEEAALGQSVPKRRNEFITARWCARAALAELGLPPAPIVPGVRGAPRWPDGTLGSITHCDGYRACALGRAEDVVTIGIDAEPAADLPDGVLEAISLPTERDRLRLLRATAPGIRWDRLLFSAKESVYKAWFPLTQRWLDFEEADISLVPDGTFTARLLTELPTVQGRTLTGLEGRWTAGDGLLLTSIVILRDPRPTS
ncbi:4'-phosphopantetheinyl transferase superfamily protein [Dactylosporangium sp. NPDC051484]|uniref:4'-phosphopantetheinyl transferase family protein n=1 Tax=Dactylosporangium sp. NPDC051484 TaxID=3154942 RepID=UPI0034508D5F